MVVETSRQVPPNSWRVYLTRNQRAKKAGAFQVSTGDQELAKETDKDGQRWKEEKSKGQNLRSYRGKVSF